MFGFMNIVMTILLFLVIPTIVGRGVSLFFKNEDSLLVSYSYGWIVLLALFELISIPLVFLKMSLSKLCISYNVILFILCLVMIIYFGWIKKVKFNGFNLKSRFQESLNIYFVIACILVTVQLVISLVGMHMDSDDAYYIGTAATSLSTDTLFVYEPDTGIPYTVFPVRYILSALMLFWAYIGKMTGIHPLIITHIIFNVLFILLSYVLWWNVGKRLFSNREKLSLYFLILNIFNIWGNTSVYTQSSFLLFRIWQGKAMLPNIIIPVFFLIFADIYEKPKEYRRWGLLLITSIAACCCSSMGVPLGIIAVACAALILAVRYRDFMVLAGGIIACVPYIIVGLGYFFIK